MAQAPRGGFAPSDATLTGLLFAYKYRFLTISQFARVANFSLNHAAEVLRALEKGGVVGSFGFVSIPGQGRTPKVYHLKRRGFDFLKTVLPSFDENATFTDVFKEAIWTPQMYHRLHIIDMLIAAEFSAQIRPHLTIAHSFLSYRFVKKGHTVSRETTDFVASPEISENKLVPDAAFIIENVETGRRALFFLEVDMGTERIVSPFAKDKKQTLHYKFSQYDRYLQSLRYSQSYAAYGDFRSFILLFVTLSDQRVLNILKELRNLPAELAPYYRFTTVERAMGDFLGPVWRSRSLSDSKLYPLVRERTADAGDGRGREEGAR